MPVLAGLKQYEPQLARRRPAIERVRTRPALLKLDDDLDRSLMAERGPTAIGGRP